MSFIELKEAIELTTGLSQDALHIYAAFIIQIAVAALSRRGLAHAFPWLCVLLAELVNEGLDIRSLPEGTEADLWASAHDIWNTMLLPTLLLASARLAPSVLRRPIGNTDAP